MQSRRWQDLTAPQRLGVGIAAIGQLKLLILAGLDIRQRSPDEISRSRRLWTAVVFINYVGPIAYFLFGRK